MREKVLILDTSILCIWLKVPGKDTCGSGENVLTHDIVSDKINKEIENNTTFIIPVSSIIETGNHIAQSSGDRYNVAKKLVDIIHKSADAESPWATFTQQSSLWTSDALKLLANKWQETVVSGQSLGDASIVDVANYYHNLGRDVEIYTGDGGLKAYEPQHHDDIMVPRRRSR